MTHSYCLRTLDSTVVLENDVPFELHIFPKGGHAVAMCDVTSVRDGDNDRYILPDVAVWSDLALTWLRKTGH